MPATAKHFISVFADLRFPMKGTLRYFQSMHPQNQSGDFLLNLDAIDTTLPQYHSYMWYEVEVLILKTFCKTFFLPWHDIQQSLKKFVWLYFIHSLDFIYRAWSIHIYMSIDTIKQAKFSVMTDTHMHMDQAGCRAKSCYGKEAAAVSVAAIRGIFPIRHCHGYHYIFLSYAKLNLV